MEPRSAFTSDDIHGEDFCNGFPDPAQIAVRPGVTIVSKESRAAAGQNVMIYWPVFLGRCQFSEKLGHPSCSLQPRVALCDWGVLERRPKLVSKVKQSLGCRKAGPDHLCLSLSLSLLPELDQ